MTLYIVNEGVTDAELSAIATNLPAGYSVQRWPGADAIIPRDLSVAILIIRETSTALEELRAIAAINSGIRIVCVHIDDVANISDLAQKYCSARVSAAGGGLGEAVTGNDYIQQTHDGRDAPKNPQKPHNC